MKIAFIRPSMMGKPSKDSMMPLVFAIIKAYTPKDVQIDFYDERIAEIPEHIDADAVALTVETFTAQRAYLLAKRFRREGKKVIMGGFHPTALPDECLQFCDAVVIGEAEDTWGDVVHDLKHNALLEKYVSRNNADLGQVQYDYSIFDHAKYSRIGLVQFSRGCKFNCDFCSIHAFFGDSVRTKPISVIIKEIQNMPHKYIFFIDDNLFADEEKARQLFAALLPLEKKWFCQVSIDIASNKELLKLMKESGCVLVLIGFESLNKNNLKLMGKGANLKHIDYDRVVHNVYEAGIMIYGTFIYGYDYDDRETMRQTYEFALRHNFAIANFNPLMPMPGTKLYARLESENKLVYEKWWIAKEYKYGYAMVIPKLITPEVLAASCKNSRYSFNTYSNIGRRLIGTNVNMRNIFIFLLANIISRKEIRSKQGEILGGALHESDAD